MELETAAKYFLLGVACGTHLIGTNEKSSQKRPPDQGDSQDISTSTNEQNVKRGKFEASWVDEVAGNIHQDAPEMNDFVKQQLEANAAKNWHHFYKRNQNKFYKDRHYLHHAFPGICNVPSGHVSTPRPSTLMGLGCGVGNALFPLAEMDPSLRIIGLDFAQEAIALFRQHPQYDGVRIRAYVQDLVNHPFVPEISAELGSIDKVLCLFCLSAIHPDKMNVVIRKAWEALRPGGVFYFRDYTRGDHAQVRFGTSKKISENFYMRQDGTRVSQTFVAELSRLLCEVCMNRSPSRLTFSPTMRFAVC